MKYTLEIKQKNYSIMFVLNNEKGFVGLVENYIAGIHAGKSKSFLLQYNSEMRNKRDLRRKIKELL